MSTQKDPLVYYPDPVLRQKAHEVREFGPELKQLTNLMREMMHRHHGMGLAAPQVGDPRRIIVVEYLPDPKSGEKAIPFTALVNPRIVVRGKKTDEMKEGCLSVPYVEVVIERPTEVTVIAQTLEGEEIKIQAKGLFARILQHEIDHLDGILILDYEKDLPADTQDKPRTIIWGSTEFTTGIMNTIRPYVNITHVVTEPPKPSGRKQQLTPTIAKQYADLLGIPTVEPENLKDPRAYNYLMSLKPDLMIVAAYGRLIPENLYTIPRYGTLNVHPSLLPKYRGATPIQAAILNGDNKTGVTLIKLAPTFDTGEILAQADYDLTGEETYKDLEVDLAELGGELIREILPHYLAGELETIPQNETQASSTRKIQPDDLYLNPDDAAEVNERKVRAYAPEPGAYITLDGSRIKVFAAHVEDGILVPDIVQPAGKKPMPWADFVRGYRKELQIRPGKSIISQ